MRAARFRAFSLMAAQARAAAGATAHPANHRKRGLKEALAPLRTAPTVRHRNQHKQ